jgi:hypothetical protein
MLYSICCRSAHRILFDVESKHIFFWSIEVEAIGHSMLEHILIALILLAS